MATKYLIISSAIGPTGKGRTGGVEVTLSSIAQALTQYSAAQVCVLAPEGSALKLPSVEVIPVTGKLPASMQNQAYDSKLTIQHNDMSLKMIQAAHRMQHHFDVIINLSYDYFLLWATPLFSTPMYHLISMCGTTSYMDNIILQLINTHSKRIAFHTQAQANTYHQTNHHTILYNGFNPTDYTFHSEPEKTLVWAGRIAPEKGLEEALEVSKMSNLPIKIMGHISDVSYKEKLQQQYENLNITWLDYLEHHDFRRQVGNALVMVFTPQWDEAMGNCIIEATLCGVPVISYGKGGIPEVLLHGETGFITENNTPQEICDYLPQALQLNRKDIRQHACALFSLEKFYQRIDTWIQPHAQSDKL